MTKPMGHSTSNDDWDSGAPHQAASAPGSIRSPRADRIGQAERLARTVLWLVLASVLVVAFVVVPLAMLKRNDELAAARSELAASAEKLQAALDAKPEQLSLQTMGTAFRSISFDDFTAHAFFTNVSPRDGYACLVATLRASSGQEVTSLPGCSKVEPFSRVEVAMLFPGATIVGLCPNGAESCSLVSVSDAAGPKAP